MRLVLTDSRNSSSSSTTRMWPREDRLLTGSIASHRQDVADACVRRIVAPSCASVFERMERRGFDVRVEEYLERASLTGICPYQRGIAFAYGRRRTEQSLDRGGRESDKRFRIYRSHPLGLPWGFAGRRFMHRSSGFCRRRLGDRRCDRYGWRLDGRLRLRRCTVLQAVQRCTAATGEQYCPGQTYLCQRKGEHTPPNGCAEVSHVHARKSPDVCVPPGMITRHMIHADARAFAPRRRS